MQRLSSLSDRMIYVVFIGIGLSLFAFIFMLAGHFNPLARSDMDYNYQTGIPIGNIFADIGKGPFDSDQQMKKFLSNSELKGFLQDVRAYFAKVYQERNYGSSSDLYFGQSVASAQGSGTPMLSSPFSGFFGPTMYATNTQSESMQLTAADHSASFREAGTVNNDFSGTNIQVAGVDEADFLKTDGKYVYLISGSKLTIVDAYPPENAKIVSKTVLDIAEGQGLQNMFLNDNRLVIFYQGYSDRTIIPEYTYVPVNIYEPKTHVLVIDISDRENPKVLKNYEVGGQYSNSRMLGTKIFLLTSSGVDYDNPVVPSVQESSKVVALSDVYYFDNPEESYTFNTVTAIDLEAIGDTDKALLSKTFMIGPGSTVYVSENSIYIAYQQDLPYDHLQANNRERFFKVIVPLLPADVQNQIRFTEQDQSLDSTQKWNKVSVLLQDTYNNLSKSEQAELFSKVQRGVAEYDSMIAKESQKTIVHKISISGDTLLNYVAKGEVPGRLLNQFSMDEHDGKFRIATTSEYSTPQRLVMNNNVYTLNSQMNMVGKLEGIAPDESIYSARFIGDRLYLVTFQRVDPFFVIDLSKDQPEVLGKLKLPGFSNYLHPYDEDHIIGIGKETSDNGAQILGVKMALFDVSDVKNPVAVDTYLIGGPQTESEALNDHKAFLFDKEKNILVIPIFSPETYSLSGGSKGTGPYIEPTMWNGFYAFGINIEKQFELKGLIEHEASNYYSSQGSRSFYINDTLYTITPTLMRMTNLEDMEEINQIHLERTGQIMDHLE